MHLFKQNYLKLSILLFAIVCVCLSAQASEFSNSNVVVKIWNHDIGAVKGGLFLKEQAFVRDHILDKQCGSGLFVVPHQSTDGSTHINEGGYPLFNIQASVTVLDKMHKSQHFTEKLTLPGTAIEIQTNIKKSDINFAHVELQANHYNFTTSGGCVWIDMCQPSSISDMIAVPGRKISSTNKLEIVASWPTERAKNWEDALLDLRQESNYVAEISRDMLDPNWKRTLGLLVDKSDDMSLVTHGACYHTKGLTHYYDGTSTIKDPFNLGNDFAYYAGHEINTDPYKTLI